MNLVTERVNGSLTTRVYVDGAICDARSAAEWILRAVGLAGFEPNYIALRDLAHSADEGSASRQLKPSAAVRELMDALSGQPCDRLYLSGRYEGVCTGVGVDLHSFELSLTLPSGESALMDRLTEVLANEAKQVRAL